MDVYGENGGLSDVLLFLDNDSSDERASRRYRSVCIMIILLFLGAHPLCAQVMDERPLQEVFRTELVYTQDRGEFQTTAGFSAQSNQGTLLLWPLQAEYGLTNSRQVQFESGGWQHRIQLGEPTVAGVGDLSLGTKYSFMNIYGPPFHGAVSLNIGVPSGSVNHGLGEGLLSYEPNVHLARDFIEHRNLQVFTQIGISFVQRIQHHRNPADDAPSAHEFQWSADSSCHSGMSLSHRNSFGRQTDGTITDSITSSMSRRASPANCPESGKWALVSLLD